MRLCSVWNPSEGRRELCKVQEEKLITVRPSDLPADLRASVVPDGLDESQADDAGHPPKELDCPWRDVLYAAPSSSSVRLLPPLRPVEVWAAGVTYRRSRDARLTESVSADCYDKVYDSDRPELFIKGAGARVVGPNAYVGLRGDSSWMVPEPELAIVLGPEAKIIGFTLGNDMSSRDIEGENPLYLPQAKVFAGSCALGPMIVTPDEIDDPAAIELSMTIHRDGGEVFRGRVSTQEMKASITELVSYLSRENWLGVPTVLLTGTGIVPGDGCALRPGDVVEISSPALGALRNTCTDASSLEPPKGWT